MVITDKQVEHALDILMDKGGDGAKARAAHEYLEDMDKVVLAKLMQDCNEKSAAAKEAYARAHPTYQEHLEQKKSVAELDYRQRDRRSAATAVIELWRTEQSNARAGARIG